MGAFFYLIAMKNIIITGATSGIGFETALDLASRGWKIGIAWRNEEKGLAVIEQLRQKSKNNNISGYFCDLSSFESIRNCSENIKKDFPVIDVLINNAGLALGLEPAHQADLDDWDTMVDTNIKGLMYCTRMVLPGMVARNRGHIVNISSTAGAWPYPGGNVYGGTKAFVTQFSRNLRSDLIGTRVRVSCIQPGMAETEFSKVRFKGDDEQAAGVYSGTEPLTAEDIAETVRWVVSQPAHVNVNTLELMSIDQSWGPFAIHREQK